MGGCQKCQSHALMAITAAFSVLVGVGVRVFDTLLIFDIPVNGAVQSFLHHQEQ